MAKAIGRVLMMLKYVPDRRLSPGSVIAATASPLSRRR